MNEEILEAIKTITSEGTDLTAVETALKGYVKDPLGGINDKETAVKFIRDNPFLNSAYDSGISKGVESYKSRFSSDELPGMLSAERQKAISEMNPEESSTDKRIRELEERLQVGEREKATGLLKSELLSTFDKLKASELGFKTEDLEAYINQGENAVPNFVKQVDRFSEILKTRVEEALKGKYNTGSPETGDAPKDRDNWEGINTDWMNK